MMILLKVIIQYKVTVLITHKLSGNFMCDESIISSIIAVAKKCQQARFNIGLFDDLFVMAAGKNETMMQAMFIYRNCCSMLLLFKYKLYGWIICVDDDFCTNAVFVSIVIDITIWKG